MLSVSTDYRPASPCARVDIVIVATLFVLLLLSRCVKDMPCCGGGGEFGTRPRWGGGSVWQAPITKNNTREGSSQGLCVFGAIGGDWHVTLALLPLLLSIFCHGCCCYCQVAAAAAAAAASNAWVIR